MPMMVLFQPPGACRAFTRSGSVYPPLGLCQLAAVVGPQGAVVVDADGEDLDADVALQRVAELAPLAVGMTATSYTLELVETWAARFRSLGLRVIVGGPHASLAPVDLLDRCPSVEAVVRGEGEEAMPALVDALEAGAALAGLPGVVAREPGRPLPGVLRAADLGALPLPTYTGLPIAAYWCPDARRRPMVTMMTTRGCPHACAFCSSTGLLGKKVRAVPVPMVLDELERLVVEHGVREVSFTDDVFTIRRRRLLALCRGMVERGLDLSWFANARADQVDPELAEAMAHAGCHQLYLGIESGDQGILDRVNKGTTVERLVEGAEVLRAAGIDRSVGFVLGLPGETDATVAKSIQLAQRIAPERLQFTAFTPLPGTPLARRDERGVTTFHDARSAKVAAWVDLAYAACASPVWGKASV